MTDTPNAFLILLINTPTPVRLWGGFGAFKTPSDDPLDPSATYGSLAVNGKPQIGTVPAMRQLIGGTAEALDFTFTGVDAISQDWVDNGTANGCAIHMGLVIPGEAIWWIRKYTISTATASGGVDTSVITLSAESSAAARGRAGLKTWTPASFKLDHPTDNFTQRVTHNGLNNTPKWPA